MKTQIQNKVKALLSVFAFIRAWLEAFSERCMQYSYLIVPKRSFVSNQKGDAMGAGLNLIMLFGFIGTVGITFIGMVSNGTAWTAAGVDSNLAPIGYLLFPMMGLFGLGMRIYKDSSGRR